MSHVSTHANRNTHTQAYKNKKKEIGAGKMVKSTSCTRWWQLIPLILALGRKRQAEQSECQDS